MFKTVDYSEPQNSQEKGAKPAPLNPSRQTLRIVLAGGGTGGHIMPLFAVTQEIKKIATEKDVDVDIRYFGPDNEHAEILNVAEVSITSIAGAKWRRYASIQNLFDIPLFFIAITQALFHLLLFMPDVIFSKGGTGALPIILVGWLYRIPIIIHESDSVPGITNAVSGRFAKRIGVSFEQAKNYFPPRKTAVVGTPIRSYLQENLLSQKAAKEVLGFEVDEPVVLIIGGSQGAQAINEFVAVNLAELTEIAQVIHQTGTAHFAEMQKLVKAAVLEISPKTGLPKRYHLMSYLKAEELKNALTAADLVISRAGSTSLFEIAAFKKPAIVIPLPGSARDHQRLNAYAFAEKGAAEVIEQTNLMSGIFIEEIEAILGDEERRARMSEGAASFFIPDAAKVLATEVIKLAGF